MEMTWPWDRFESDKPLGRGIRDDPLRFQDHRATEKKFQIKFKEIQRKKKGPKTRVSHFVPCSLIFEAFERKAS